MICRWDCTLLSVNWQLAIVTTTPWYPTTRAVCVCVRSISVWGKVFFSVFIFSVWCYVLIVTVFQWECHVHASEWMEMSDGYSLHRYIVVSDFAWKSCQLGNYVHIHRGNRWILFDAKPGFSQVFFTQNFFFVFSAPSSSRHPFIIFRTSLEQPFTVFNEFTNTHRTTSQSFLGRKEK